MRLVEILGKFFLNLFPVKTYIVIPSYIVIIFSQNYFVTEVLEFDFSHDYNLLIHSWVKFPHSPILL